MKTFKISIPLKITIIYFLLGFFWILFSDMFIHNISNSAEVVTSFQTYKGWFFVSVTSVFLFYMIRNELNKKLTIEKQLVKAKIKAEESDQLKSAFLANMSHEIRTPLNGLLGFCELLIDPSFNNDDRKIFASHMSKNGNDLLVLMTNIMEISKLQENQYVLSPKQFDIVIFFESIYSRHKNLINESSKSNIDLILVNEISDENRQIFADKDRLEQVFNNLIENAIKFTDSGFIKFGFKETNNKIEFFVKDSGCGIDEINKEQIFKPFYKGLNPMIGNTGFGLGLAISKGIVSLMGGNLLYNSSQYKGCKFYFEIDKEYLMKPNVFNTVSTNKKIIQNNISNNIILNN